MTRHPTPYLALALVLLLVGAARAQDGSIVARETVELSQEDRLELLPSFESRGLGDGSDLLAQVAIERITYLSDGLRVKGYLVEPTINDPEEQLPAVIYNRGGNRDFAALTDRGAVLRLAPLAAHGYVVVASQYRGNAGGEGQEEFGGADVRDVLNLLPLLDQHPRVDADRIGMFGWSRGGLMTYLALAQTDRIRGAVVGAGAADMAAGIAARPAMETRVLAELVPNWEDEREVALEARSPVRWADRLHKGTPILLLHGTSDWRVQPTEAFDMARALYETRHPMRLMLFEGGDHGLSDYRAEVFRAVTEWLDRYVRDRAPLPNLEPHGR